MSTSAVKFAILFSRILRHSRNSRKFSPAKITESTVCNMKQWSICKHITIVTFLYCSYFYKIHMQVLICAKQPKVGNRSVNSFQQCMFRED